MGSQRVGHDWETELNWTEQIYFYSHCHLHSQAVDPLLAQTKLIHLAYPQMGHGSIPFQFRGLLWWGSNAQTDLKAEIGDYEWAGRNKVLAKFLSKSLLLFETCQKKSQCTLISPIIPVLLLMQPLYLPTWTQLSFSLMWQIEFTEQAEYVTQVASFATHSVSLKCAASGDCFSKRNLWNGSCN